MPAHIATCVTHYMMTFFLPAAGMEPVARGTAQFLLDPKTAATTLAVYARWGSGKVG